MKRISFKNYCVLTLCLFGLSIFSNAQEGLVIINQDASISELLELKKEINKNENDSDRYKIQIYSGSRAKAESMKNEFASAYNQWSSKLVYETPNYKIWIGSFRSRLDADRALIKIKRKFPSAFIFKPLKED